MKTSTFTPTYYQQQETQEKNRIAISMLLNAVHFFLDCAFIIHTDKFYRLVVFHINNVLLDKGYTSLKGAKIAFHKMYRHQACTEGIKARWDEYIPDKKWIEKKIASLPRTVQKIHIEE